MNETARAMLQRHMDENQWTEATLWHLVSEWLDLDPTRVKSLSGYLNDTADTEREASLDDTEGDEEGETDA